MSLKTRVDKLASKAGLNDCPGCKVAAIQIYDQTDPRAFEPVARHCSQCGRERDINHIVICYIPDNHRDAA